MAQRPEINTNTRRPSATRWSPPPSRSHATAIRMPPRTESPPRRRRNWSPQPLNPPRRRRDRSPQPSNPPLEPQNQPLEPQNPPLEPQNQPLEPQNQPLEQQNQPLVLPWYPKLLQKSLESVENFADWTSLGVLVMNLEGTRWFPHMGGEDVSNYLPQSSIPPPAPARPSEGDGGRPQHSTIVFIVSLTYHNWAQYGWRANISQPGFRHMVDRLGMHEAAVQNMFGRPDYLSAFGHQRQQHFEFFCQHPPWAEHSRLEQAAHRSAPCSVYLHHDKQTNTSRYVISSGNDNANILRLFSDLNIVYNNRRQVTNQPIEAVSNPFLVHGMMSSYAFTQSIVFVQKVRRWLRGQISDLNNYSKNDDSSGSSTGNAKSRLQLKKITKELHLISQNCDLGIVNVEVSTSICEEMLRFYKEMCSPPNLEQQAAHEDWNQLHDSMAWLIRSWHSHMNWLTNYKARKDTAMNLVFNLVTQQDSAVNIEMAQQGTEYSSSMNAITILTMVFLPGTFIAGVFGSGILDGDSRHGPSDLLTPFLYICIPLTALTVCLWQFRKELKKLCVVLLSDMGINRRACNPGGEDRGEDRGEDGANNV